MDDDLLRVGPTPDETEHAIWMLEWRESGWYWSSNRLGLEVRHVTLSTGQVAAAMATLGLPALQTPEFWWAVAGLAIIGPLNLAVSFFLAFRVALAAHGITDIDRQRIYRAVRQRLRTEPASFLVPPPDAPAPTRPSHG